MNTTDIDKVINKLEHIMRSAADANSYLAIFANVYWRTTIRIKKAVEDGEFEDAQRMVDFDVYFANLYINAYHKHLEGGEVSACWKVAFDQKDKPLAFVQHLMLGMNAHINYDLALTAAYIMEGKDINDIKKDFDKVNDILASLTKDMLANMGKVSPLMFLLDWLGQKTDERIINFSIAKARDQSYRTAIIFHTEALSEDAKSSADNLVTGLANQVAEPKSWLVRKALGWVAYFEGREMVEVVNAI